MPWPKWDSGAPGPKFVTFSRSRATCSTATGATRVASALWLPRHAWNEAWLIFFSELPRNCCCYFGWVCPEFLEGFFPVMNFRNTGFAFLCSCWRWLFRSQTLRCVNCKGMCEYLKPDSVKLSKEGWYIYRCTAYALLKDDSKQVEAGYLVPSFVIYTG